MTEGRLRGRCGRVSGEQQGAVRRLWRCRTRSAPEDRCCRASSRVESRAEGRAGRGSNDGSLRAGDEEGEPSAAVVAPSAPPGKLHTDAPGQEGDPTRALSWCWRKGSRRMGSVEDEGIWGGCGSGPRGDVRHRHDPPPTITSPRPARLRPPLFAAATYQSSPGRPNARPGPSAPSRLLRRCFFRSEKSSAR